MLKIKFDYTCCVKTGENDRFQHKKYIKTQNVKSSKMDQQSIYISSLRPKECQKNHF